MTEDYVDRTSWNEVGEYLNVLAERIDPKGFSGVYGIPRGGSVLAAWLSHKLYLPLLFVPDSNCIIIDDICDSGSTLTDYLNKIPGGYSDCYVTVMFNNILFNSCKIDYYYKQKGDKWIVFPWEQ